MRTEVVTASITKHVTGNRWFLKDVFIVKKKVENIAKLKVTINYFSLPFAIKTTMPSPH